MFYDRGKPLQQGGMPAKKAPAKRLGLDVYKRKRDFTKTPEPKAKRAKDRGPLRFVVQKHRATALHYDFRLEAGGGTVMIWDEGVWMPMEPDVDPVKALKKGELRLVLDGKKLKGSWTLVNTGDRRWLLMKRKDEYASTEDITETQPRSVRTNRLLAEIARDEGGDVAKAATGDPGRRRGSAPSTRRSRPLKR